MNCKTTNLLIVFLSILFMFSGCTNKEYNEFKTEFESKYLEIVETTDITNTLMTLKNLNTEENEKKIGELSILLNSIQNEIPKNRKEEFESYHEWYEGLVLLRDSYDKWDELSIDVKGKIWNEIWLINRRKESLK